MLGFAPERIYPRSMVKTSTGVMALSLHRNQKVLLVPQGLQGFVGESHDGQLLCPLSRRNADALGRLLPEFRPQRLPEGPSFGFGDRLGLATPGHARALETARVFPVFAQQSVRENARTGRSFADVLADAVFGAFQEGYRRGFGADADHLKNGEEAVEAARLGYTLFTCDPSDDLVYPPTLSAAELRALKKTIPWAELRRCFLRKEFEIKGLGRVRFSQSDLETMALQYWRALKLAEGMYRALEKELPDGFDFELSIDETDVPTTPKEHLFLSLALKERGIRLTSLAPRFPGVLEKALDYRGDPGEFREALRAHVAIARGLGPYKISLHSGSDKFSLYPIIAKETGDLWHVKTAGTSYLVALAVIARVQPELFGEILEVARTHFEQDRASYHTSSDPKRLPPAGALPHFELSKLLHDPNARQILHITYGSALSALAADMKKALFEHEEEYAQALCEHFGKHLSALGVIGGE